MRKYYPILIFFSVIILSSILSFDSAGNDMVPMNPDSHPSEGDYIEYDINAYYDDANLSGTGRIEIGGTEEIKIEGESYECIVVTITGSGEIEYDFGVTAYWELDSTMYEDVDKELIIKEA